jgi:hypothetical protein
VADEIDKEVVKTDALVGDLLASARLDFAALSPRPLDPVEVARRALERAAIPGATLRAEGTRSTICTAVGRSVLCPAETYTGLPPGACAAPSPPRW